ncbi:MAG: T9SS type A sorting domain-containing protein [Bacteroidota bacterium]
MPEEEGLSTFNLFMGDAYGCQADTSVSINVVKNSPNCLLLSLSDMNASSWSLVPSSERLIGNWQLYPNPTQTQLTIAPDGIEESWQYTVYTATGQVVRTGTHRGQLNLSTAQWPKGMYFVNIVQDGRQQSWKVVKE